MLFLYVGSKATESKPLKLRTSIQWNFLLQREDIDCLFCPRYSDIFGMNWLDLYAAVGNTTNAVNKTGSMSCLFLLDVYGSSQINIDTATLLWQRFGSVTVFSHPCTSTFHVLSRLFTNVGHKILSRTSNWNMECCCCSS